MWQVVNLLVLSVAALVLAAIVLNVICWWVLRRWPSLLLSENERLSRDYVARFSGELRTYLPEWFDIKPEQWSDFAAELEVMISGGGHVYAPFVEFRHPPRTGAMFNFHDVGFRRVRDQGPWPISREFFNIFFFGGSTTVHVGPDWTSVPSRLQQELTSSGTGRDIRVYNFGCGSYFSTQERILLQQLLLDGAVPDAVVFLDGVNDFYFLDGRPSIAGFFQHALDEHNRDNDEKRRNELAGRPEWKKLRDFTWTLPMHRLAGVLGENRAKRNASASEVLYRPTEVDPTQLSPAMERYWRNKDQIEALCDRFGIASLFVVQPTPAYKYDLRHHIALNKHYGLGGHERSGVGYALMAERLASGPPGTNFLWLADIQENERQPLYLDNMHYTSKFAHEIARKIAERVLELGWKKSNSRTRIMQQQHAKCSVAVAEDGNASGRTPA